MATILTTQYQVQGKTMAKEAKDNFLGLKKAIYAGSFDPFHIGHQDIIDKALKLFDQVVILVAISPQKIPFLTLEERIAALKEIFKNNKKVKVDSWDGLVVDYAMKNNIHYLVRGLRPVGDFDSEFQMSRMNSELSPQVESVFFMSGNETYYYSSSLIREIYKHNGSYEQFVPKAIAKKMAKLKK